MKRTKALRDLNLSVAGGFVSGITIFAYQYLLSIGWQVWACALAMAIVFMILYLPMRKDALKMK